MLNGTKTLVQACCGVQVCEGVYPLQACSTETCRSLGQWCRSTYGRHAGNLQNCRALSGGRLDVYKKIYIYIYIYIFIGCGCPRDTLRTPLPGSGIGPQGPGTRSTGHPEQFPDQHKNEEPGLKIKNTPRRPARLPSLIVVEILVLYELFQGSFPRTSSTIIISDVTG